MVVVEMVVFRIVCIRNRIMVIRMEGFFETENHDRDTSLLFCDCSRFGNKYRKKGNGKGSKCLGSYKPLA